MALILFSGTPHFFLSTTFHLKIFLKIWKLFLEDVLYFFMSIWLCCWLKNYTCGIFLVYLYVKLPFFMVVCSCWLKKWMCVTYLPLSVWSQILLAKNLLKGKIIGYLYVGLIFAKSNLQARCWTKCCYMLNAQLIYLRKRRVFTCWPRHMLFVQNQLCDYFLK